MIDETKNEVFIVPLDLLKVLRFFKQQQNYWSKYNDEVASNSLDILKEDDSWKSEYYFGQGKESEYEWLIDKFTNEWHKFV